MLNSVNFRPVQASPAFGLNKKETLQVYCALAQMSTDNGETVNNILDTHTVDWLQHPVVLDLRKATKDAAREQSTQPTRNYAGDRVKSDADTNWYFAKGNIARRVEYLKSLSLRKTDRAYTDDINRYAEETSNQSQPETSGPLSPETMEYCKAFCDNNQDLAKHLFAKE